MPYHSAPLTCLVPSRLVPGHLVPGRLAIAIALASGAALSTPVLAQDAEQLASMTVVGDDLRATTESTESYQVASSTSANGLTLTPRQTPQSVSFLTRQQMDDEAITSTTEAVERLPGVSAIRLDGTRTSFQSRGDRKSVV